MDTTLTLNGPVIVLPKEALDILIGRMDAIVERIQAVEQHAVTQPTPDRTQDLEHQISELKSVLLDLGSKLDTHENQISDLEYKLEDAPDFRDFPAADDMITSDNLADAVSDTIAEAVRAEIAEIDFSDAVQKVVEGMDLVTDEQLASLGEDVSHLKSWRKRLAQLMTEGALV